MEAYSDYSHTSLWNSDDLPTGAGGDAGVGPQSAALSSLIEDKEIAAKAVAIVISSARRGVVSLCADVAELLKAKQSLERQLSRLASDSSAQHHGSSSGSSQPDVCDFEVRSGSGNTSGYHSRPAAVTCAAVVHSSRPSSNPTLVEIASANPASSRPRRRHRSVHLPAPPTPSEQDELASLREEVRAALRANAAIVNELMSTKRELSRLRGCRTDDYSGDDSCPLCRGDPRPASARARPASVPLSSELAPAKAAGGAVSLLGCACRHCFLLRRQGCPRRLLQLTTLSSNQIVRIKDQVALVDGRRGYVKYMGHVDNDPDTIWLGVEFQKAVGSGDGKLDHKRYFSCRPNHGEFVRLEEVDSVFPRPVTPSEAESSEEEQEEEQSFPIYVTDFV